MRSRPDNLQIYRLAAALGGLLAAPMVLAQTPAVMPDPTRPPAGFVDQLSGAAPGARSAGAISVGAVAGEAADAEANSGLQSVLIPKHGKPVAIIGGKYVPLGERYGDFELVAVGESQVVLARGKERKVLKLTPRAEKSTAQPPTGGNKNTQRRPTRSVPPRKESETRP